MSHHEVGPRGGGRMAVLYVHDWDVIVRVTVGKKKIDFFPLCESLAGGRISKLVPRSLGFLIIKGPLSYPT